MDISKIGSSAIDKSFGRGGQGKDAVVIVSNLEIHKPVVTFCDMSQAQKEFAFETAEHAFKLSAKREKRYFKDIAEYIKNEFDNKFQGTWHVIVGLHFGSFVSYESQCMIHFYLNQLGFMIYKFG
ncbi:unnamed protein product (macronuclear) [Paramecium tetraurelia]|uniref:Dynein light chain n=2 Tax=Paramecium TaxID=5884 RepID=A0E9I5_PARTE|nr:uncharacterized protein GSPATT00024683001 [Paramecium tetraurelia]CAD8200341.1 unnamed protein product [Paramecium octaurelia]CAK91952.1 unnamed protein product [Paramecium tetraurelia]|eukprot:XP_001459349.1 hypothetical protein (macronuclear) [Paramecium tetraurelia strain d4-2]